MLRPSLAFTPLAPPVITALYAPSGMSVLGIKRRPIGLPSLSNRVSVLPGIGVPPAVRTVNTPFTRVLASNVAGKATST